MAYRNQLALTFTKKATEEMKLRILNWLERLSRPLGDTQGDTARKQCSDHPVVAGLGEKILQQRAQKIRETILHDYGQLSVFTIDTFFQRMVRAFEWEARLPSDYTLDFDSDRLLQEAIERVVDETSEHPENRAWIRDMMVERLQEGKSWNVQKMLLDHMGSQIFDEKVRDLGDEYIEKIGNKAFMGEYQSALQKEKKAFEDKIRAFKQQMRALLQARGLQAEDFKMGNKSFMAMLLKEKGVKKGEELVFPDSARKAMGEMNEWYAQKSENISKIQAAYPELYSLLQDWKQYYDAQVKSYTGVKAVLALLPEIALLGDILRHFRALLSESNSMHLSQTLSLLRALVAGSDTPFILEKMGTRYTHFLLDEFQDTSRGQWEVLKPLLHNGLSEGGLNFVVGDVKQAIYRWRNSDWSILQQEIYEETRWGRPQEMQLEYNHRSDKVLVDGLREVFASIKEAAKAEFTPSKTPFAPYALWIQDMLEVYKDMEQQAAQGATQEGYMRIEKIEDAPGENGQKLKAREQVLAALPQQILDLQVRGYKPSDIAILVRNKADGQAIAAAIMQYAQTHNITDQRLQVVSSDTFLLCNIPEVQLIMAILKESVVPEDSVNTALIEQLGQRLALELPSRENRQACVVQYALPEAFERLLVLLGLNKYPEGAPNNLAFLQALHQQILQYCHSNAPDTFSFVQYWEQHKAETPLTMEYMGEAVRIVTIHKSKGLEYPVVLIPFCDWKLDHTGVHSLLLWVKPQTAPLNQLDTLPVRYVQELLQTEFARDYVEEKLRTFIDELNLFYVAVTRACKELYVSVPQKSGGLYKFLSEALFQEQSLLTFGEPQPHVLSSKKPKAEPHICQTYPSTPPSLRLKVRLDEDQSAAMEDLDLHPRQKGLILHALLSRIRCEADIETEWEGLSAQGLTPSQPQVRQEYISALKAFLHREDIAPWFDGSWKVYNEAEILLPSRRGQRQLRPDRVMEKQGCVVVMDYKFGQPRPEHQRQIDGYVAVLKEMGYKHVEGKIIYINI